MQKNFTLRNLLELTDGNLGAHLRKLEDARNVEITKTFIARKPRTFIAANKRGRQAFENHVAALETILNIDDAES